VGKKVAMIDIMKINVSVELGFFSINVENYTRMATWEYQQFSSRLKKINLRQKFVKTARFFSELLAVAVVEVVAIIIVVSRLIV